ncbi:nitrite/sulfite reductase [Adhaeribacter aquaticus]|uniref:nitrite/sulfite reductase n=1 Tax=Adhaeribacter aquaticus TaxID=299567 RepID=UPI000688AF4B|nr:nitrite/sulfite reductase [Adhaeribacter aquaticus]
MLSFRSELENPIVQKEIIELDKKIRMFREGQIPDEKFRSLRLTRGIYGQRQPGVQMIRIKLPFGKVTVKQLYRISDVSDEYASKNLHLTTRQDIQIHFVSLDRTPELWNKLAEDDITLREACGNTVRNVTASPNAGIDPKEPFDVSPYAYETFRYFLRNPICQDMGRKFKIAFSSSDDDTAFSYIHDLGFIPKVQIENGQEVRGFKVMVAGGLGAQPMLAHPAYEFLPEDQIIPFTEAVIRVFDRHGERVSRNKARMKYLIQKIGFDAFMELVTQERTANKAKSFVIDRNSVPEAGPAPEREVPAVTVNNQAMYDDWYKTNVFEQKQKGYYGVWVRVLKGDISTEKARVIAKLVSEFAADDIRITPNQGLLFKYVRPEALPYVFHVLNSLGFALPGFDSTTDITTCPGTDTCNLGITNSMDLAAVLERMMLDEFPDLIYNNDIKIKISGCMNSCGQHGLAQIGFHGSSIKHGANVIPALQVMLGGGTVGNGVGRTADRVVKVPTKKGPHILRTLFNDFEANHQEGELFNEYYDRQGKNYFYTLLKPLADLTKLEPGDYVDWGHVEEFVTAIGVGECAGVMIDLVATLLFESEEKAEWANEALQQGQYADSIYHSYSVFVSTAKALLLAKSVGANTQVGIINDFETHFVQDGTFTFEPDFKSVVMQINQNEPNAEFAAKYLNEALNFLEAAKVHRNEEVKRPEVLDNLLKVNI